MDWIAAQIAIGHFLKARSLTAAIGAVLCLREDCCNIRADIDALCIPLIDGHGNDSRKLQGVAACP